MGRPADGLLDGNRQPERVIAKAAASYIDFLASRPTFIRLVQRRALSGGGFLLESAAHLGIVQERLGNLAQEPLRGPCRALDETHLLLSTLGAYWFAFAQADTLIGSLGLDTQDPAFVQGRKLHVAHVILNGILAR